MDNNDPISSLLDQRLNEIEATPELPQATSGEKVIDNLLRVRDIEDNIALKQNAGTSADRQAEALRYSKKNNLPIGAAYRQLEDLKRSEIERSTDEMRHKYPVWGSLLTKEDFGPIAQDPAYASDLQFLEKTITGMGKDGGSLGGAMMRGFYGLVGNLATKDQVNAAMDLRRLDKGQDPALSGFSPPGMGLPPVTLPPEDWRKKITGELTRSTALGTAADKAAELYPPSKDYKTFFNPDTPVSFILSHPRVALELTAESLPASAPSLVGFIGGGPLAGGAMSMDTEFAATLREELNTRGQKMGLDMSVPANVLKVWETEGEDIFRKAEIRGGVVGLFDALSFKVSSALGAVSKPTLLRLFGLEVAGITTDATFGMAGEGTAQALTEDEIKVKEVLAEGIGEVPGGAVQTAYSMATEGGAIRAENNRQKLVTLGDRIRASKAAKMSPETILAHAAALDESGAAPSMSAPAEAVIKLFQEEGFTPEEIEQSFPDLAASLDEAQAGNAEVKLSAADVVRMAQLKGYNDFTGDVRIGDAPTANEAKAREAETDQLIADVSAEDQVRAVEASIQNEITQQLVASGQEQRAAQTQAKLFTSTLANIAQRAGLDVNELYNRYNLSIRGEQDGQAIAGTKLEQPKTSPFGEPAVRVGDSVFKASDYFPNWEKGTRETGAMSIEEDMAIADWGHQELLQKAREALGKGVVDTAVEANPDAVLGHTNAAGEFKSLVEIPRDLTLYQEYTPAADAAVVDAAVEAASLDSSNTLSKSQNWAKGRDIKIAMQDRVLAALAKMALDPSQRSPEALRYLIQVGAKDAMAALAQNPNAIGWYDVKTRQALAVMSLVHPEIQTEPNARFAFTWALAVTSNGIKVGKNFELADTVYRRYKATGQMPTDVQAGQAQKAINESLKLFNDLARDWGIDNLRQFMLTDFTVGEITGINKDLKPSGEYAETLVRGAAILGPKIGNGFFSNLYGVFDALTMDRWLVRTWGRWTGTLIQIDPEQVSGARDVLRNAASGVDAAVLAKELRAVTKKTKTKGLTEVKPGDRERLIAALEAGVDTDEKIDELAAAVQKASQEPKFRQVMNKVAGGAELRKKGNNLAKYLDGQKEQPAGPAERNYIREVFQGILTEVKKNPAYANLTMADLQAVLWYAEKRLYETAKEDTVIEETAQDDTAGEPVAEETAAEEDVADSAVSGYADEEAPDYANAAAAQARADGVPEEKIKATLKEEAERGPAERTGTTDQQGAGSPAENVAGGQGSGAQAARGFTREEKRSFIHRAAIHLIRSNRERDAESSWSYAGTGGEGRRRPRVLKALGVTYVDQWKAGQKLRTVFKANGIQTPVLYELETGSAKNAARFVSAISEAKAELGAIGEAVHVYKPEDYAGLRLFLTEAGDGGFALKPDGDIVSVFSAKGKGNGRALLETAVAAGGRKLDCFHTILPEFYAAHGFRGVSRLLWNDEVAKADMPNWDKKALARYNNGEPDVVFMVYDPAYMGDYDRESTPLFEGDEAYGQALEAQSNAMTEAPETGPSSSQTLYQNAVDAIANADVITNTPEFRRWFGKSVVVDENGKPLIVYHGSEKAGFTVFSTDGKGAKTAGTGAFFTNKLSNAMTYSGDRKLIDLSGGEAPAQQGNVPVFLKIENPLVIDAQGQNWSNIGGRSTDEIIREARQRGQYDGVIFRNLVDEGQYGWYDDPADVYVTFDPSQIKSVQNEGAFDPANPNILKQNARGFITFTDARNKFEITLTGKANLSTFVHESAHFFLEVMQDLVARGEAPQQIIDDLEKLRQWTGVEPGGKFETKHHEMFARGFEAYLREGRAPDNALQDVFNRFRAWLVFIYKKMTALNVDLTDDVRGVFDRLVASDAAIAEARTKLGWSKPMPQEALLLTDAEYARYVEAWQKASDAQAEELDARMMREAAETRKELWRDETKRRIEEEQKKVAATRGYIAWKALTEGKGLDDIGRTSLKIDPDTVPPEWGRDVVGMTEEGGVPLDLAAELLGFNSGETMLQLIGGAKYAWREIPNQVKQAMEAEHGHLDAAALADAANEAVMRPVGEVLLSEYRALASAAGIKVEPGIAEWIAATAKRKVQALTQRQLDPTRWRRAELKSAQEAAAAAAKGDKQKAALAKRQQMMAAAMYRETIAAAKRIETIQKKLTRFTKDARRAKLGQAGDLYLDAIDEILEGISFKNVTAKSLEKQKRLAAFLEEAEKNDLPVNIPDYLTNALGKRNYSTMTLEELEGVHDTVMGIWHQAKLKNELKLGKQKRDLEKALTEMEANAQAALGDPKIRDSFTKGWKDRAADKLQWVRAQLTKMEFLFGWMDGKPSGGLMHQLIYQPLADANNEEFKILKRFNSTIFARFRNLPKAQKARLAAKRTFMGKQADGATIIAAALNLGNEANKEKLLKGYGWSEAQLRAEIDAFMTKEDWELVQYIWDEIDTLWPRIVEVTKAATGLPPERVEALPVQTPFGQFRGGYYPVVYDPERTEQVFKNQQKADALFSNNYLKPTLGDGFTKGRTSYAAPILLNLSVLPNHLASVVHYVTHYEAIAQANKITSHPRFANLVKAHMGDRFYREIRPWLQDIAQNQDTPGITRQEFLSTGLKHLRGGYSIASMGFNIFTGFKQLYGVTTALDAISARYWASGVTKAWLSPKAVANWKFALEKSKELEPLVQQVDRDIAMLNQTYQKSLAGGVKDAAVRYAFAHIGYFQLAVNIATWHGAFEEAIANGKSEADAINDADSVVRKTQSAGAVKDLSRVQRGSEASRMVSMFYSWFNVLYNRLDEIARETNSISDVPRAAKRIAILVFYSAILEESFSRLYENLTGGDDDDEEERGYVLSVLLRGADQLIATLPLVRAFVKAQSPAPVMELAKDVQRIESAATKLVTEGELPTKSEGRAAAKVVSAVFHVPAKGVYDLFAEMHRIAAGDGK